jgi:hypothetical protein
MSPGAEDLHLYRLQDSRPYSMYKISLALGVIYLLRLALTTFLSILL